MIRFLNLGSILSTLNFKINFLKFNLAHEFYEDFGVFGFVVSFGLSEGSGFPGID